MANEARYVKSLRILTVLLLGGFLVASFFLSSLYPLQARAGVGTPLYGFAWSSNVGWVSFNCEDQNSCASSNYSVNLDETTGELSGFAWSSNVGWINFSGTKLVGDTFTGNARACSVYRNQNNCSGTLISNIERGGWDGIITLSGSWANGVRLDRTTSPQCLRGFAWGGGGDEQVVGWLQFDPEDSSGTRLGGVCLGEPRDDSPPEIPTGDTGNGDGSGPICFSEPNSCGLTTPGRETNEGVCEVPPPPDERCPEPDIDFPDGVSKFVPRGGQCIFKVDAKPSTKCVVTGPQGFSQTLFGSGGKESVVSEHVYTQEIPGFSLFTVKCFNGNVVFAKANFICRVVPTGDEN